MKKLFLIPILLWFVCLNAQTAPSTAIAPVHVEQSPTYPGGTKALAKLFMDSIDLPKVRWQDREEQDDHPEITLALVINEQGTVDNVQVLKSINPKTDARCVSLARKLKFTPAMQAGKPVKVTYKLPLKFDMEFY